MNVLIIEDQQSLLENLEELLVSYGYSTRGLYNTMGFMEVVEEFKPDIVLLDIGLPGRSGIELLRDLKLHPKFHDLPVVILSGQSSEHTMTYAYDSGADDFIQKPFNSLLLIRKLRAIAKRCGVFENATKSTSDTGFEIDMASQQVLIGHNQVSLTMTEFNILRELIGASGGIVSRRDLIDVALGGVSVTDRTIDVHVCSLRKKLLDRGAKIETVRGRGYRIAA